MLSLSRRDLWLLVLLTLLWGVNWPIMKIGVTGFPPLTFRVISMFGGLFVLAVMIRSQGTRFSVPRADWLELMNLSFLNMTAWFLLSVYGVKLLASGRAAILGYTLPIWAALWGVAIFHERTSRRLWMGVLAAGFGVALLISREMTGMAGRPTGLACMLAAACMWALGTHLMRRRRLKTPLIVITFWGVVQALAVGGLAAWLLERGQWGQWPTWPQWSAMLYNALLMMGVAQVVWFRLATILTPVASSLSVMMIPVIGVGSSMLLLGERPFWEDYVALVCILIAIATVLWPDRGAVSTSSAHAGRR